MTYIYIYICQHLHGKTIRGSMNAPISSRIATHRISLTIPPYTYFTCTPQDLLYKPNTSSMFSHQNISLQPSVSVSYHNNGQVHTSRSCPHSPYVHCPCCCLPHHHNNRGHRRGHWQQAKRLMPSRASAAAVPQRVRAVPEAAMPAVTVRPRIHRQ